MVRAWFAVLALAGLAWAAPADAQDGGGAAGAAAAVLQPTDALVLLTDALAPPPPDTPGHRLALPAVWSDDRPEARGATAWYRVHFRLQAPPPPDEAWSVYLPYLYNGGRVFLNGQPVGQVAESTPALWVRLQGPQLLHLPGHLLRAGDNRLDLRLVPRGARLVPSVPQPLIGPWTALEPTFQQRQFWTRTMPQISAVACGVAALLMLAVWWRRRDETLYGLFGIAAALWGLRTLTFVVEVLPQAQWFWWRTLYHAGTAGFIVAMVLFACTYADRLAGRATPRWRRHLAPVLGGYAALGPLAMLASGGAADLWLSRWWVAGLVPLTLIAPAVMLRAVRARPTPSAALLLAAVCAAVLAGVHDQLLATNATLLRHLLPDWSQRRLFLLHHAANLLLLVMGALLVERFLQALAQLQELKASLERRVAEREAELERNFRRIGELDRQQARLEERQRLVQDMHDGLGSQLIASLLRLERGQLPQPALAEVLRGCIADMRMTLDAAAPDDHDLSSLVGNFRFRWDAQLQGSAVALDWRLDLGADRVQARPGAALQLLRIAQEAITNAVRHAGARHVAVHFRREGDALRLRVHDDGRGIAGWPAPQAGHGLRNMQARARRLGSVLEVATGDSGTCIAVTVTGMLEPAGG
jgi:signal transduction histidine kinase